MTVPTGFDVRPLEGAGPLRFGMDANAVASILGSPEHVSVNHLGQTVEFRGALTLGYGSDQGALLNHIAFGPLATGVVFKDTGFFVDDDRVVIERLIAICPAGTYLGFLVFPELGLALTGFHDRDLSQRAVTLFPRGAWDKRIGKLTPYTLP